MARFSLDRLVRSLVLLERRGQTQAQAADLLEVDQPKASALLHPPELSS